MRWPGRSGCVTTRAMSCPSSRSARSDGTAKAAVPAKTILKVVRPLRGLDGGVAALADHIFDAAQRVEARQAVGEEDTVEVIQLVLKSAGGEPGGLDAHLFAMAVASLDHDTLRPLDLADPSRLAQAAFVADLRTLFLDHLWIDQAPDLLVVALDHADAQRYADLVRCQAGARGVEHGFRQVVEQALDGRVDTRDFLRLFTQDGMFEGENRPNHERDFTHDLEKPSLVTPASASAA